MYLTQTAKIAERRPWVDSSQCVEPLTALFALQLEVCQNALPLFFLLPVIPCKLHFNHPHPPATYFFCTIGCL